MSGTTAVDTVTPDLYGSCGEQTPSVSKNFLSKLPSSGSNNANPPSKINKLTTVVTPGLSFGKKKIKKDYEVVAQDPPEVHEGTLIV